MTKLILLFIFSVLTLKNVIVNGERTKDKMYEKIEGSAACFRRLNGTHQTGCTSKRPSSVGAIHIIKDLKADLEFVLKEGLAAPYVVVLPINVFSSELVKKFSENLPRIAGVVLHMNISKPEQLSHESVCPNSQTSLKDSCTSTNPWNPWGTGLLNADIPFPVFAIQNISELEKMEKCWQRWNSWNVSDQPNRPLCFLELAAFMFATKDSSTCLRRSASVTTFTPTRFCDPLGSRNAWATLWPRKKESVLDLILLTARMDATSMFYDVTPGADAHLTGLITLLATAYTLKHFAQNNDTYKKNVMFVLFNGETQDYIGSQRFVYDVLHNEFPLKSEETMPHVSIGDIKLIVDLNQMFVNENGDLFAHHLQYSNNNVIDQFLDKFSQQGDAYGINLKRIQANNNELPPSSLHSFIRQRRNVRGVVLTDHEKHYWNKYYNSLYDNAENIDYKYQNEKENNQTVQTRIANVAKALAETVYTLATDKTEYNSLNLSLTVDKLVDELFHCYLDTAYCNIFELLTPKDLLSEKPLPSYVSVNFKSHELTTSTGLILAWLVGNRINRSHEDCIEDTDNPTVFQYMWVTDNYSNPNATVCMSTTMHFSLALSPAFTIENYNWTSNEYSTWTESVWNEIYMRMFLVPSYQHEVMTLSIGITTFIVSSIFIYFIYKHSDTLFSGSDSVISGTSF